MKRLWSPLAIGVAVVGAFMAPVAAQARTGRHLRSVDAANPGYCPASTGVGFDGRRLLVTCLSAPTIDVVSAKSGGLVRTVHVAGRPGFGAAAWDEGRNRLWVCEEPAAGTPGYAVDVVLVDVSTGAAQPRFRTAGCHDGLAFDGIDDSVWVKPAGSATVFHYAADGRLLGQTNLDLGLLGGANPTGVAVGGNTLFLATTAGRVYQLPKSLSQSGVVATDGRTLADLECDSSTFSGRDAIWVQAASTRRLDAYEVPPRTCGTGGLPPPPSAGRTVVYRVVSGNIRIHYPTGEEPPFAGVSVAGAPGGDAFAAFRRPALAAATSFIPFKGAANVPIGSTVDAREGRISVTSAADLSGRTQRADFFSGIFTLSQGRSRHPTTEIRLTGTSFRSQCGAAAGRARSARSKKVIGRLFGSGRGRFRTRGKFSAATVRGTTWLTEDRCDGTLTKVTKGKVSVRDLVRHKTVIVRAGHSYLARATGAAIRRLGL